MTAESDVEPPAAGPAERTPTESTPRATRIRATLLAVAVVLAAVDLIVKHLVEQAHPAGPDFGFLSVRLSYNPGIAFSLGDTLPAWVVIALTSAVTLGITLYALHTAPEVPTAARAGMSMILAGAAGNLIDRIADGAVTDYLYTGWFPTFNLADSLLTCGVVLLIASTLRAESRAD
ncbi:signal peptidase II [Actinoalloteichus hymeniacidonis]|uniref:signal peptidase II n=1 Tax=Actinoalloteichus hymeniacidonis TaxID=340345 RepID=UPI001829D6AD|nr:signal peptidase II [Actinoalloteichus hymeniacidonis]MBB5909186.1 signal peptidase II [Actinoalloteichus hymeniacidonis]